MRCPGRWHRAVCAQRQLNGLHKAGNVSNTAGLMVLHPLRSCRSCPQGSWLLATSVTRGCPAWGHPGTGTPVWSPGCSVWGQGPCSSKAALSCLLFLVYFTFPNPLLVSSQANPSSQPRSSSWTPPVPCAPPTARGTGTPGSCQSHTEDPKPFAPTASTVPPAPPPPASVSHPPQELSWP